MEVTAMKHIKLLSILLVFVFVAAFQAPAMVPAARAAGTADLAAAGSPIALTITNPLPKATTVTLTGPKSYTFAVPKGATITKNIEAGKYKYSYQGCLNKAKKGNLKVKGTTAALKIPPCKMAIWSWYNEDDSKPATIKLSGWVSYSVTIGPGQVQTVSWVADTYQFTLTACGKTFNERVKVQGKKSWIIYACK
jgi:hypothetical protein